MQFWSNSQLIVMVSIKGWKSPSRISLMCNMTRWSPTLGQKKRGITGWWWHEEAVIKWSHIRNQQGQKQPGSPQRSAEQSQAWHPNEQTSSQQTQNNQKTPHQKTSKHSRPKHTSKHFHLHNLLTQIRFCNAICCKGLTVNMGFRVHREGLTTPGLLST